MATTSGMPLYHRLKAQLLQTIESGGWQTGDALPSEPELARMFAVSRTTVRQAIGDLVSSGYIVRQQGRGTFVARRSLALSASTLYGFAEELRQRGHDVAVDVRAIGYQPCPADIATALEKTDTSPVIAIERVARTRGRCIFYESSYLVAPFQVTVHDAPPDATQFDRIYGFFERHGVHIALGRQVIRSALATPPEADILEIAQGSPVLVLLRITRDQTGSPVEHSRVVYPADLYEYEVQLLRHPT